MATTTTTTNTTQQLDPFVQDIIGRNYNFATQVANQPYQAYGGPRIANFTPDELAAFAAARNAATNRVGSSQLSEAERVAREQIGYGAAQFQKDVAGYMNPFQTNVIDSVMNRMAQARAERDAATKAQMAASRAFGNERRGVYEAQLAGAQDLNNAQVLSELLSQGYSQAAGLTTDMLARRMAAGQTLAGYGQQALGNEQAYAAMLQGVGQNIRDMNQRNLDVAYSDWQAQRNYPKEQLNILLSAAAGMPSPVNTTQTMTGPGQSTISKIGDISSTIGGILDLFKKG